MGGQGTPIRVPRRAFGAGSPYPGDVAPSRDSRPGVRELFLDIAESCDRLDAPTYAALARCAAAWCDDEPLSSLLAPYADARVGDMVPLRLLAAVHGLALARQAPEIAIYLPTVGGTALRDTADEDGLCRAFLATVEAHRAVIAAGLARVPQTNEVGRTTGLAALLRRVHRGFGLPVRLHEIGCSAGLSLRVDALVRDGVVGDDQPSWGRLPDVVERVGCDLAPVDASTSEGRLLLTSFVWADHLDRFERLRSALDVAGSVEATLIAADAREHVRSLRLVPGTILVLWHSAMWLYLSPEDREGIRDALERLGRTATRESPLVHIALEPMSEEPQSQHRFTLAMTTWPGLDGLPPGVDVPWGTTPPAGVPVAWHVPCAGGIVRDGEGRILLVRRGQEPARGLWSIPGGRVEGAEAWDAAAVREVREETDIKAGDPEFVGFVVRDADAGSTYLIADFLLGGDGEPHAGDDADEAGWFTPAQIASLDTSPGLVEALREWGIVT